MSLYEILYPTGPSHIKNKTTEEKLSKCVRFGIGSNHIYVCEELESLKIHAFIIHHLNFFLVTNIPPK